jgi:peptidoglycan-N-acetylglucosamine deacetylase
MVRPSTVLPRLTRRLAAFALAATACATATPSPDAAMQTSAPTPPVAPSAARPPIEVAVTFDDLPAHGPPVAGTTRMAIIESLNATLRKHQMPPAVGYVNGHHVEARPEEREVLKAWLAAGNQLGSHTWSHANLREVGLEAYLKDIDRNEPLLAELVGTADDGRAWKTFRYPYLQEGTDLASRDAIRRHLLGRGYRVAQVTIDFGDWAWNDAYARCAAAGNTKAQQSLREGFRKTAVNFLRWADAAGQQATGHRMRHVLLLHAGPFQAETLDALLTAYKKAGVRFITLDEALQDPAYAMDPGVGDTWGSSFLEQLIEGKNAPHPPFPLQPLDVLDAVCR